MTMNEFQDGLQHRSQGLFKNILLLFIREAIDIAKDSNVLSDTFVFTVRPGLGRVGEFEVIVIAERETGELDMLDTLFMEPKKLIVSEGVLSSEIKREMALAFGIEDTANILKLLKNSGHLLTPHSLVRIVHMHNRRMLGESVIYEVFINFYSRL